MTQNSINIEQDIKNNRIKEGYIMIQISNDNDWSKKWVILTKNYLYIFDNNNIHHHPIQKIILQQVHFISAYFVQQSNQSHVISIKFNHQILYLSAQSNNQKRAWIFSIQRTIEILQNPEIQDSRNILRDILKKSTGLLYEKQQRKSALRLSAFQEKARINKRLRKYNRILEYTIQPHKKKTINVQYDNFQHQQVIEQGNSSTIKIKSKVIELQSKIIERIIIQRMIEIVAKSQDKKIDNLNIIKDVYQCQVKGSFNDQKQVSQQPPQGDQIPIQSLFQLFQYLINHKSQDPKPIIDFIAYLATSQVQKLQLISLQFCLHGQNNRFFIQLLLQILNEQTDQNNLNRYTAFIYILYQKDPNFFYTNDIKLLIQILTRELQMYRSDLNQLINLQMINALVVRNANTIEFKKTQIQSLLSEIIDIGSQYNKIIAKSIYELFL